MSADPPRTPAPATPRTPSTTRRRTELAFSPRFSTISVRGDVIGDDNERRRSSTGGEERRSSAATPFGAIYAGTPPPKTLRDCYASALEHEAAKPTSLSREVGPSAKRPPKKRAGIADVTNRGDKPRRAAKARPVKSAALSNPPLR